MAAAIRTAKVALSSPLYACDFDDGSLLVVGGGGGPGGHGIKNKLTLIDTSNEAQPAIVSELELSSKEDSVQSLAVGQRRDRSLTVFAGINGSVEDAQKSQNQHFRIFTVSSLPAAKTAIPAAPAKNGGVKITETFRGALFDFKDADTYQRRIRLTQPFEGHAQVGAVSSGLSRSPQLAFFDAPAASSLAKAKRAISIDLANEAMDLDVVQTGPDTYQLAYCDKHEIFTVDVTKDSISEPKSIYVITDEDGLSGRPSYKSIRYLSPSFLFAVANNADRKGVILSGYRLPKQEDESARLAVVEKLPSSVKQSTGLAVRNLSPVSSPDEKVGETQYVVAVAGSDSSISLLTLEHRTSGPVELLSNLAPFKTLKGVHDDGAVMTALSFSTFTPPKSKSSSELSIKLASVSTGQTAVIHTIPLKKHVDKSAAPRKGGPPKPVRYVVALPSKQSQPTTVLTLVAVVVVLLALIGQVFMEMTNISPSYLGAKKILPASWNVQLGLRDGSVRQGPAVGPQFLESLLPDGIKPEERAQVVLRHEDDETVELGPDGLPKLRADVHDEEAHGPAKNWEELGDREKHLWRQRLKKTGHWVEGMGETVFKGILFGEIGGAIGGMVGDALH